MIDNMDPSAPPDGASGEAFWAGVRRRARQMRAARIAASPPSAPQPPPVIEGDLVQIRFRDREQLVALRMRRPHEQGRTGRSLTQRQLAAHIGISHGHYGDLEAGRRHPSLAVAERLATFFDVPLIDLCHVVPIESGRLTDMADENRQNPASDARVSGRR